MPYALGAGRVLLHKQVRPRVERALISAGWLISQSLVRARAWPDKLRETHWSGSAGVDLHLIAVRQAELRPEHEAAFVGAVAQWAPGR